MDIQNFETAPPTLALERYFAGNTCAWGIFEDRFGTLRRQFTVDIDGQWDGHTLVLDEHFVYRNGEKDQRVWTIEKLGPNRYKGHANDVIGSATGAANGNAFSWIRLEELIECPIRLISTGPNREETIHIEPLF